MTHQRCAWSVVARQTTGKRSAVATECLELQRLQERKGRAIQNGQVRIMLQIRLPISLPLVASAATCFEVL